MPYSLETAFMKKMEKLKKDTISEFKSEAYEVRYDILNYVFKELYLEAIHMYDGMLDQYYSYRTKLYYRHETGIGTGNGINLYRGNQIIFKEGYIPFLSIKFNGKDMDGYGSDDSTDKVLSMVMNGIRGVPSKGWWTTWTGSYDGKYFSVGDTTMTKAFDLYEENLDDISNYIFDKKISDIFSSKKYKYFW